MYLLFNEEESFSGKRPHGNSDWFHEFSLTFLKHKLIRGSMNLIHGNDGITVELVEADSGDTMRIIEKCLGWVFLKPIKADIKLHIP